MRHDLRRTIYPKTLLLHNRLEWHLAQFNMTALLQHINTSISNTLIFYKGEKRTLSSTQKTHKCNEGCFESQAVKSRSQDGPVTNHRFVEITEFLLSSLEASKPVDFLPLRLQYYEATKSFQF